MRSRYNADKSYLFVDGKGIFKFKADNKSVNLQTRSCLGNTSDGFSNIECKKVSLNRKVYGFSVDSNYIDKFDILNIRRYSVINNSVK